MTRHKVSKRLSSADQLSSILDADYLRSVKLQTAWWRIVFVSIKLCVRQFVKLALSFLNEKIDSASFLHKNTEMDEDENHNFLPLYKSSASEAWHMLPCVSGVISRSQSL